MGEFTYSDRVPKSTVLFRYWIQVLQLVTVFHVLNTHGVGVNTAGGGSSASGGNTAGGNTPVLSSRIVQTRYGKLQGLVLPMENQRHLKSVEVFLGIPYATPPVRSNRFSPTRTPSPWDGVRIADTLGPVCPQVLPDISNETAALEKMPKGRVEYLKRLLPYLKNQSEDCLYLNIYSPFQGRSKSVLCNQTSKPILLIYEGVSKCFRTGRLERELQMVQLPATKCSCITIL
jgi:hypothetical protein